MYTIAPQFIRAYILAKFGTIGKLSASGREFVMESLFVENDWKKHMSVNVDTGLWQCFKTGKQGNFISFYAQAEGVGYLRAQQDLIIKNFGYQPDEMPEQMRQKAEELNVDQLIEVNINSHESDDPVVVDAWKFLFGRSLFNTEEFENAPYYVAKAGPYKNRIIIPFRIGNVVVYYQARSIYGDTPKYLNPPSDAGVKSSDVLYPYDEDAEYVVVAEGPLDAISLQLEGVNATCTMGCSISHAQADILATFEGQIIIGYDNDSAGAKGLDRFEQLRKEKRMGHIYTCNPPQGCKDWNDARIKGVNVSEYVKQRTSLYDFDYKILNLL